MLLEFAEATSGGWGPDGLPIAGPQIWRLVQRAGTELFRNIGQRLSMRGPFMRPSNATDVTKKDDPALRIRCARGAHLMRGGTPWCGARFRRG
jgi:hypothetical protein